MKKILILLLALPFVASSQVNLWVKQIPDTLYMHKAYDVLLNISSSSDFSSLMVSIEKDKGLELTRITNNAAKIYKYGNVVNIVWQGYRKENPQQVDITFSVKDNTTLPAALYLRFVASYLVNGLKGEQLAVYKYVLRRKDNNLLYVLENQ